MWSSRLLRIFCLKKFLLLAPCGKARGLLSFRGNRKSQFFSPSSPSPWGSSLAMQEASHLQNEVMPLPRSVRAWTYHPPGLSCAHLGRLVNPSAKIEAVAACAVASRGTRRCVCCARLLQGLVAWGPLEGGGREMLCGHVVTRVIERWWESRVLGRQGRRICVCII